MKKLNSEVWGKVKNIDLSQILVRLVVKQKWSIERATEAIEQYRQFLYCCVVFPGSSLEPTSEVDVVWHDHILHMKKYNEDCIKLCGRLILHEPYPVNEDVASEIFKACKKTGGDCRLESADRGEETNPILIIDDKIKTEIIATRTAECTGDCQATTGCQEPPPADCALNRNSKKMDFKKIRAEIFA
ncbi:MAG: glycine-rich domain-containing protein-like [Candidatus Pacebacteria bacterium]|nr:glycine-rich domain-containing protein-like [Candidatus Paceibacterota bacterium]MBP9780431.1 glycine-rich domain-containing protein-like [Candidatus Paceibacterota bacterium]